MLNLQRWRSCVWGRKRPHQNGGITKVKEGDHFKKLVYIIKGIFNHSSRDLIIYCIIVYMGGSGGGFSVQAPVWKSIEGVLVS